MRGTRTSATLNTPRAGSILSCPKLFDLDIELMFTILYIHKRLSFVIFIIYSFGTASKFDTSTIFSMDDNLPLIKIPKVGLIWCNIFMLTEKVIKLNQFCTIYFFPICSWILFCCLLWLWFIRFQVREAVKIVPPLKALPFALAIKEKITFFEE